MHNAATINAFNTVIFSVGFADKATNLCTSALSYTLVTLHHAPIIIIIIIIIIRLLRVKQHNQNSKHRTNINGRQ